MIIQTLYAKLAVTLALALGFAGLIYALFVFSTVRENILHADQSLNRNLAKTLVAERNLVRENELDEAALKTTFQAYMDVNPSIEIYLLDLSGKILSYSADPGRVHRTRVDLKPVHMFLKKDAMFPILGDDPRSAHRQKVFSVTPIPSVTNPKGYLYVILRGEEYDREEQFARDKELLSLSGWVIGIALLVSLIMGLAIFYTITRRLRMLSTKIDTFRSSGFHTVPEISVKSGDELDQLESNIQLMAQQIVSQFDQISKQDAQRRDLFASLSHDLRTPLATLHGYLETLQLKASGLRSEERDGYLARALKSSNRLKMLVDELFELAKLDAIHDGLQTEPFPLPELVQDVLQQFEPAAEQAGVKLHMVGDTDLPFFDGNIGMMQRVFENLISNALRHVDKGDDITIATKEENHHLEITVSDTGCGIDHCELNKIFDPLYQVNNEHRGGEHSGLGLAIVKRVLELHGSDIHVTSELGEGTAFKFLLKTDPL